MPPRAWLKKVESQANSFLFFKLAAIRKLCVHAGWLGKFRREFLDYREHANDIFFAFLVLQTPDLNPIRYAAANLILELFSLGWRAVAPLELLGKSVHRNDSEVSVWKKAVLHRDGRCMKCSSIKNLEAHHIVRWVDAPALRLVVENGMTLCHPCHLLQR